MSQIFGQKWSDSQSDFSNFWSDFQIDNTAVDFFSGKVWKMHDSQNLFIFIIYPIIRFTNKKFYEKKILPSVINSTCNSRPIQYQRKKVVKRADIILYYVMLCYGSTHCVQSLARADASAAAHSHDLKSPADMLRATACRPARAARPRRSARWPS